MGGSLLQGLGMAASFIPGMQPFAPFLGAAGAMMNGNAAGGMAQAAQGAAGMMGGGAIAPMNGGEQAWQGAMQSALDERLGPRRFSNPAMESLLQHQMTGGL
jgi:hypothetical protein